ncbi:MAG TPA: efflux RND transporter permease subunit [Gammaproteobacteria bacterium]|jgi:HAE1 family hydrophobic/amphiphilic exporter-1|nr:efflux RND transporter permease subunit [Xanthomonadales bacterium]HOP21332.1 efflux RND transporter permease subunit [Gammaproteobacteria bacterium]HPI94866.1 efflux RND transporter permease subunit [Gammaproteobacteria bacterium]HPQ86459.1 efflux RND transporter permease subunit [Gammaproteobacteria bacterium]
MYKFAINRPITILMAVMALIIFGLKSYTTMPLALFPNVDFPIITIKTVYPGADAKTVESKITDKIEEAVSGINQIDKLFSTSYAGVSFVVVHFELERDLEAAANDVREKIGGVVLPNDSEAPLVQKISTAGEAISVFISSKSGDLSTLMQLVDEKIKPKLQRIPNVGDVDMDGYRDREIRIMVDPYLLNKYKISSSELQTIIASANFQSSSGKSINNLQELIIKFQGEAKSIQTLRDIEIRPGLRLQDIAQVYDGLSDEVSISTFNGKQGVMLNLMKIPGTNVIEIINEAKRIFPNLKETAGDDFELTLIKDQSDKILQGVNQVKFDLIFGAILAIVIVFTFLRNITATIVSALAIPTSIIGTFAIINYLGYDLNKLTLIGLTLAIGIFIDDAIVVIENISKKMESGVESFKATYEGVHEIAFSLLAISAMLLAVFIPIAFMSGMVGKFFNAFAITVASGVVISYLVAIMLIPSVSARVLQHKESKFHAVTEKYLKKLDNGYVAILKPLIRFKYITVLVTFALLILSGKIFNVGMDFVPTEDNSEFQITAKAEVGTSLGEMQRKMQPIIELIKKDENVEYYALSIGYTDSNESHKGLLYIKLKPVIERSIGQVEIINQYREKLDFIKDMTLAVEKIPPINTGTSNAPVQIVITGDSLDKLKEISNEVSQMLGGFEGAVDIDSDYQDGKPEITISILRHNSARLGITAAQIATLLSSNYSSDIEISNYEEKGREYDITLRFDDQNRADMESLKKLQIRSANGEYVFLDGLINIEQGSSIASVNRFDRERKVMISSNLKEVPLNSIVEQVEEKLPEILPKGYNYTFSGDVERMKETAVSFSTAVGLAVILIYLILAALYESLVQPIIIMITMPLAFTGVITALGLSGNNFSLFVMIGIILLLGMVGKNAILVVDFANRAIKQGKTIDEALIQAGEKRLRPILMTTFAMVGAMIPLAFGSGAGHELNSPVGLSIIGGLISSTILALLVVPAFYKILYPLDRWLRKWYEVGKI